ncbi:MAG: tRNA pseudouridine(13) synthase TruD [Oceanicoccus sp.]
MSDLNPIANDWAPADVPYAYGKPSLSGSLRDQADDFFVEEILGFEPEGEGEHVFLWIEKTDLNTQQLAGDIARLAKVPVRQVSYAGMKDRRAVTRQWFSVHLPGQDSIDWQALNSDHVTLLKHCRHLRKLRRGTHRGNRFVITVKNLSGDSSKLASTVASIARRGVPNYFGEQRFGHGGANLMRARQMFQGEFKPKKHQRGIYLSAARAYLFNQVLARRVVANNWDTLTTGELLMLDGSHSVFSQGDNSGLESRLLDGDIHLTGPLYGKQTSFASTADVAAIEASVLQATPDFIEGLERAGLKAERRALRLMPGNLEAQLSGAQLALSFTLPTGCFATALVRELVNYAGNHNDV